MNFPDERANDYRDPIPTEELFQGRRPEQVAFSELVASICVAAIIVMAFVWAVVSFLGVVLG